MIIHFCFGAQSLFSISSNKIFNSTLHHIRRTKWINCKPSEVQRLGRNPEVVTVSLSVPFTMGETEREGGKKVFMKYKIGKNELKTKISYPKNVKAVTCIFPLFPHPLTGAAPLYY